MINHRVYRGFNGDEFPNSPYFFSKSQNHAADYGDIVARYEISFNRLFDSSNETDIKQLIDVVGPLEDPFDNAIYNTPQSFISACAGCDTWEPIEDHICAIRAMGYDAIRIYEGGYENFIIFSKDQIKRL